MLYTDSEVQITGCRIKRVARPAAPCEVAKISTES